jgi:uncharacterized protein
LTIKLLPLPLWGNNKIIVKKMRNVVGQTPRGADFFTREKIISKIYRHLDASANLFLAAPRRVGKASIMRALEDNPKEGYHFVYVITESIHDVEEYYSKILRAVLESDAMGSLVKKRDGLKKQVLELLSNLSLSIKLPWGIEASLNPDNKAKDKSFQSAFEEILARLDTGDDTIVIMVDEFPQTVENIREKHGNMIAEQFLRLNREQRQTANTKTGSIGLPAVVKKLTSDSVINDLTVVEIPPLSEAEATQMARDLFNSYKIKFQPKVVGYLLEKLKWLIPFHIQLSVQELIDIYESNEQVLVLDDVDKAFKSVLNLRNDMYFNHYYTRLAEAFPQKAQQQFAHEILNYAAVEDWATPEVVSQLAKDLSNQERESVLEALVYDGYIVPENGKGYHFHSALLQQWWTKKSKIL